MEEIVEKVRGMARLARTFSSYERGLRGDEDPNRGRPGVENHSGWGVKAGFDAKVDGIRADSVRSVRHEAKWAGVGPRMCLGFVIPRRYGPALLNLFWQAATRVLPTSQTNSDTTAPVASLVYKPPSGHV